VPPSHKRFTDDGTLDPADITDADAFEELVQNNDIFITTTLDQPTVDEELNALDTPVERSNHMEAGNSEVVPEVVIDNFPSAAAGAPIPSTSHSTFANESRRDTPMDSVWSPFTSECDWTFAHWAKMRGPSLSAVSDLLAIPEVWTYLYLIFISLIQELDRR
jgi:hypothetical protein